MKTSLLLLLLLLLLLYSRRIHICLNPDKKFTDYTGWTAHSVQCLCRRLKTEEPRFNSLQEQEFSLSSKVSRPLVVQPSPTIQWVMGSVSLRIKHWGLHVASNIHLVLRLTMNAVIPPLHLMPSSCAKKQFHFHKFTLYNSHKELLLSRRVQWKKI
jgi:hypothetical protein